MTPTPQPGDGATGAMRLLLVVADRFRPIRVDVDVLFAGEIAAMGHQLDWIMQSDAPARALRVEPYGGGRAWVGPAVSGSSAGARALRLTQSLWHDLRVLGIARPGRYQIVQVKDKFVGALPALLAARRSGARFVYWLSFPFPEAQRYTARTGAARYPWVNRLRGRLFDYLLYRVLLPRSDLIFVQSAQMREDIACRGIPRHLMFPVPMGVEQRALSGSAQHTRPSAGNPTLVYLGTMAAARKIGFVLDVFARVLACLPRAALLMVGGDASEVDALRARAVSLGVADRVTFTGRVPREEALARVREADVCLSPFYPTPVLNSTSPTKLVEYLAAGRPVVANHHPEQSRVIAESGGGLCVAYDVDAFAGAAVRLLNDPKLARAMGRRGRKYIERRSYPRIAREVVGQYQELLRQHA